MAPDDGRLPGGRSVRTSLRPARARRVLGRGGIVLALVSALLVPGAVAQAHVVVLPEDPVQGSWTVMTVRVPNESATATTTRVTMRFPLDTPVPTVRTTDEPGWTVTVTVEDLAEPVRDALHGRELTRAVTEVVWEADDAAAGIGPDEYRDFSLQAGPLPAVPVLVLPTAQAYDDGTEVLWGGESGTETTGPYPAPSIELLAPAAGPGGSGHHGADATPAPLPQEGSAAGSSATVLSLIALGVSLMALVGAAVATRPRAEREERGERGEREERGMPAAGPDSAAGETGTHSQQTSTTSVDAVT